MARKTIQESRGGKPNLIFGDDLDSYDRESLKKAFEAALPEFSRFCQCGKPESEAHSPCCSEECWRNKFTEPGYFFYDEYFCSDIDDLMCAIEISEDEIEELPDDWELDCQYARPEKVFEVNEDRLIDVVLDHIIEIDDYRLPEDDEKICKKIREAIASAVDFKKIKENMPTLYYPSGSKFKITKKDIVDYYS